MQVLAISGYKIEFQRMQKCMKVKENNKALGVHFSIFLLRVTSFILGFYLCLGKSHDKLGHTYRILSRSEFNCNLTHYYCIFHAIEIHLVQEELRGRL